MERKERKSEEEQEIKQMKIISLEFIYSNSFHWNIKYNSLKFETVKEMVRKQERITKSETKKEEKGLIFIYFLISKNCLFKK